MNAPPGRSKERIHNTGAATQRTALTPFLRERGGGRGRQ